jgi:invasion protein IalB
MSLVASVLRVAASGLGLTLALGLALSPAHAQGMGDTPPTAPGESNAKSPQLSGAGAAAWVKLCDRGQLKGKDKDGLAIAKDVDMCMTLTEQIHPSSGKVMIGVTFQQLKLDGGEKQVLSVTVPKGVAMERGAAITVFPPDLWLKVQRSEKLDAADETRLMARTVKLAFKQCLQTGCIAETEATPLLIDLLKYNAGLLVHTVRSPRTPVSQPVSLTGFAQALEGPPTDTKRFKEAREQLMKEIAARLKKKK